MDKQFFPHSLIAYTQASHTSSKSLTACPFVEYILDKNGSSSILRFTSAFFGGPPLLSRVVGFMHQVVALIDCNNFYCSCERAFNAALHNRPVLVLSNNDGCVVARSNEAKVLGVKMGQPVFECRELIEQHEIQVF